VALSVAFRFRHDLSCAVLKFERGARKRPTERVCDFSGDRLPSRLRRFCAGGM
jgi:hypothetical protein